MQPEWSDLATSIKWIKKPQETHEGTWDLSSARVNLCYNAVDRHVIDGRADDVAFTYESTISGEKKEYTYAELLDDVARAAGVLSALEAHVGTNVILATPTTAHVVIMVLACLRRGTPFEIVAPTSAADVTTRVDAIEPHIMVASSSTVRRDEPFPLAQVLQSATKSVPYRVITPAGATVTPLSDADFLWDQVMQPGAVQPAGCASVSTSVPAWMTPRGPLASATVIEQISALNDSANPRVGEVYLLHAVSHAAVWVMPFLQHMFAGCHVVLVEGHDGGVEEIEQLGSVYGATTIIPC